MSNHKSRRVMILVGVLLLATGAGAYTGVIDILDFNTTVQEPIEITDEQNWSDTMYPGEQMSAGGTLTNPKADEDYVVAVELKNFSGTANESDTLNSSRYKDNGYISMVSWAGQDHTFDLLNDGQADYYKVNASDGTGVKQVLNVTTLESAQNGTMNITFNYSRVSAGTAPSAVVKQHYNASFGSDDCGNCHGGDLYNSSSAVHADLIDDKTCEDCHEASMQDTHMDCNSACHTSYPVTNETGDAPHGPFADNTIQSEYFCGSDCHGDQITLAHNNSNSSTVDDNMAPGYEPLDNGFCPTCHGNETTVETGENDTLMDFHGTFEQDCVECHGIASDRLHETYESDDCQTCHANM